MKNKIRATIIRTEIDDTVNQEIELTMFDDKGHEYDIGTINIDEIEISADFIKYFVLRNQQGEIK